MPIILIFQCDDVIHDVINDVIDDVITVFPLRNATYIVISQIWCIKDFSNNNVKCLQYISKLKLPNKIFSYSMGNKIIYI